MRGCGEIAIRREIAIAVRPAAERGVDEIESGRSPERGDRLAVQVLVEAHLDGGLPVSEEVQACAESGRHVFPRQLRCVGDDEVAIRQQRRWQVVVLRKTALVVAVEDATVERQAIDRPLVLRVDGQVGVEIPIVVVRLREESDPVRHAEVEPIAVRELVVERVVVGVFEPRPIAEPDFEGVSARDVGKGGSIVRLVGLAIGEVARVRAARWNRGLVTEIGRLLGHGDIQRIQVRLEPLLLMLAQISEQSRLEKQPVGERRGPVARYLVKTPRRA